MSGIADPKIVDPRSVGSDLKKVIKLATGISLALAQTGVDLKMAA